MKIDKNLIKVDKTLLRRVCIKSLCNGLSISNIEANDIFSQIFYAELCGKKTHGLVRIPWLFKIGVRGHKKANPHEISNFITHFDCSKSIGYLAANEIVTYINKQKSGDIHIAVGHDIFPTGVLGYYAKQLLKDNVVFVFGTTPSLVKLTDGKNKILGTNPFACGFSYGKNKYFMADITTAQSSFGELLAGSYGLLDFDKNKYHTSDNRTPDEMSQLFNDKGMFAGSILQSLNNKPEFRQYSFMLMIQFLTTLISQNETERGNLVFIVIKKKVFGGNKAIESIFGSMEKQIGSDKIPGMHSDKLNNLNMKSKEISIPTKLWRELKSL